MLTDEQIKKMVLFSERRNGAIFFNAIELAELLKRYIYDHKGKEIEIELPKNQMVVLNVGEGVRIANDWQFFDEFTNIALKYYANKFIES